MEPNAAACVLSSGTAGAQVREQVSANKTVKAAGNVAAKAVDTAKNAAVNAAKHQVRKIAPPVPCTGSNKSKC